MELDLQQGSRKRLTIVFSVSEFMTLFVKTVAERTKSGQRQDIEEQCMHEQSQQEGIADANT